MTNHQQVQKVVSDMLKSFSDFFPGFQLELAQRALLPIAEVSDDRLTRQGIETALDFVRCWDARPMACQPVTGCPNMSDLQPPSSSCLGVHGVDFGYGEQLRSWQHLAAVG